MEAVIKCSSVAKHMVECDKCFNQVHNFYMKELPKILAAKAGRGRSAKKAKASRKNGRLGGRPRKNPNA